MPNTNKANNTPAPITEENKPKKKEFKIFHIKNSALYRIEFIGGGVVPKDLAGSYTHPNLAVLAIKAYKEKKVALEAKEAEIKKVKEEIEAVRQAHIAKNKAKKSTVSKDATATAS